MSSSSEVTVGDRSDEDARSGGVVAARAGGRGADGTRKKPMDEVVPGHLAHLAVGDRAIDRSLESVEGNPVDRLVFDGSGWRGKPSVLVGKPVHLLGECLVP